MKTSTVLIGVAVLGALGVGAYFILKPSAAPAAKAPQQPATAPAGYAAGGNSTANTISQYVGIGQQAANIFGQASSAISNIES